jgi:hypothetical protein
LGILWLYKAGKTASAQMSRYFLLFFSKIVFLFQVWNVPLHSLLKKGIFIQRKAKLFDFIFALGGVLIATVAQLVEQLICNQLVGGSSPSSGSIRMWI